MSDTITEEAVEWFVKLKSSEVSSGDRHVYNEWLLADESHRVAYQEVVAQWSGLDEIDDWARSELAQLNLNANLLRRRRKNLWTSGFAAAALFAFAIIMLPLMQDGSELYLTNATERRQITLEDGSRMHLNSASSIEISFDAEVRQLSLTRGEGVFDVEHDSNRPFVVLAGKNKIIALGTRFSVYHTGDQDIQVTVLDGRVAIVPVEQSVEMAVKQFSKALVSVENGPQGEQPESVILEADQQARLSVEGQISSLVKVRAASETAWIEGKLVFDNTPLREVVKELSRYIPGDILVDQNVPNHPVTGIIHIRSADTMLGLLSQVVPVTPIKQSASLTVLHAASPQGNRG